MDASTRAAGVILIAATNRPDILDPVALRPGRSTGRSRRAPDLAGRRAILKVHARAPLAPDADLDSLASDTVGMSGADPGERDQRVGPAHRPGNGPVTPRTSRRAVDRVVGGELRHIS